MFSYNTVASSWGMQTLTRQQHAHGEVYGVQTSAHGWTYIISENV